jgi:hypothetical protein
MTRAAAVQAQDLPTAGALWQKVEREILAQAPMVPTYNGQVVDFVSKRVGNYKYHPQWGRCWISSGSNSNGRSRFAPAAHAESPRDRPVTPATPGYLHVRKARRCGLF